MQSALVDHFLHTTANTNNFPITVVAGTNGKGSTSALLSSILQAHGLKVGLFTSPHVVSLAESFRVNGKSLDKDTIANAGLSFMSQYGAHMHASGDTTLTAFEMQVKYY